MTSPQVSEAEVLAACRAECDFDKLDFDGLSRLARQRYMDRCRAALTAAAQVRERAMPLQDHARISQALLKAMCVRRWPPGASISQATLLILRSEADEYARAILAEEPTEPDSGPDVLGIQKGEE